MAGWMHQSKSGGQVQKDIRKKATKAAGTGMLSGIAKSAAKRQAEIDKLMKEG